MRVAANIFSLLLARGAGLVLVYSKTDSEVDAAPLTGLILDSGIGAALPYCREGGGLGIGRVFGSRTDLVKGAYGIMEPADRLKDNVAPGQLSAVVCPGIAFDANLTRLGRGAGYYDRFLKSLNGKAFLIGCAFDCQLSAEPLPREEHDVPMDAVIAETLAFPAGCCPALKPPEPGEA
jgi:5-formyltetrahydrofolate cyclo-ligase